MIGVRSSYALRDIGKIEDITNQLLPLIHRNISREDMASYEIKAVMLDNHVEGSLLKFLAKEMGLALFLDLPNL